MPLTVPARAGGTSRRAGPTIAFRRLPDERLHAVDAQPVRPAVRRADDVEARAARCRCSRPPTFQTGRISRAGQVGVPGLHRRRARSPVDAVVVGRLGLAGERERIGQAAAATAAVPMLVLVTANGGCATSCRAMRRYAPGVVADAVAAAQDGRRLRAARRRRRAARRCSSRGGRSAVREIAAETDRSAPASTGTAAVKSGATSRFDQLIAASR